MMPAFLPHTVLDAVAILPPNAAKGRENLRALRDRAIADGAHVMLVVWLSMEWVMLAVEVPPGVVIHDAAQLIPNLMANPEALAQMQQNAREGRHLQWLELLRPGTTTH